MANPGYGVTKDGESIPLSVDRKGRLKLSIEWMVYIIVTVNFIQAVGIAAIFYTMVKQGGNMADYQPTFGESLPPTMRSWWKELSNGTHALVRYVVGKLQIGNIGAP